MTADLVERLRAALDEAERLANEALGEMVGVTWEGFTDAIANRTVDADLMCDFIAQWDPNTVLRLVERDRALLMEYEALKSGIEEENGQREDGAVSLLAHAGDTRDGWLRAGRLLALQHGVERAAEFWLGDNP